MVAPVRVSLPAEDPDLVAGLSADERQSAAALHVPGWRLPEGEWDAPRDLDRVPASVVGLLVVDGVLVRHLELAGHCAAELLGPGDVCEAPHAPAGEPLVPVGTGWRVVRPARVALLPRTLLHGPGSGAVAAALLERTRARAERLAVHQAIAQLPRVDMRVLAALWHLADRFGRFGPGGVFLPLPITHRTLGELVGARRPTVTLAVRDLSERGHLARRPDGGWQLARTRPETADVGVPGRPVRPRAEAPPHDDLEVMARRLREATRRLDRERTQRMSALDVTLGRLAEAREPEIRARDETIRVGDHVHERRAAGRTRED